MVRTRVGFFFVDSIQRRTHPREGCTKKNASGKTDFDFVWTCTQVVLAAAIVTKGGKGESKFHFFRFVRVGMRADVAWGDGRRSGRRGFSRASKRSILMNDDSDYARSAVFASGLSMKRADA